jgi:hypothetical protein
MGSERDAEPDILHLYEAGDEVPVLTPMRSKAVDFVGLREVGSDEEYAAMILHFEEDRASYRSDETPETIHIALCADDAEALYKQLRPRFDGSLQSAEENEDVRPTLRWSLAELAESAYVAYGKSTGNKNFRGDPMPEFSALPHPIQAAWEVAVRQVMSDLAEE